MTFEFARALRASAAALMLGQVAIAGADEQLHILGWLEHATEMSVGLRMDAKLDTGAKTSAIHAEILSEVSDDIEIDHSDDDEQSDPDDEAEEAADDEDAPAEEPQSIVFRISNEEGEERIIEREVVRMVAIKLKDGGVDLRPVVQMTLCIAGLVVTGDVSLADRSGFNYPLLIGRDMLDRGDIAVNPDVIYTVEPDC